MGFGILVKHLKAFVLQQTIARKLAIASPEYCVVLTYHRILPKEEVTAYVEPGMYVTPASLRSHIQFLKNYFEILTIDQAEKCMKGTGCKKSSKPCCVLTFDDGWRDFYIHASPVLLEEGVPAVVYLPTNLIDTDKGFWTDRLAQVLAQSGVGVLTKHLEDKVQCGIFTGVGSFKQQLFRTIELLKKYPYQHIAELLEVCEREIGITCGAQGRTFMNWDEVRELFATGLISFGSHTANHAILTTLPTVDVQAELVTSREKLLTEKVVEGNISFCYPNGNYTCNIKKIVSSGGFSSAMTCDFGWNLVGNNMFSLKRISLHQDITSSKYLFAYRLTQSL